MKCLYISHLNGLISNSSVNKMLKQASSLAYKMCSHLQWNTVCYLKSSEVFEQPVTRNPPKAPILFCRRRSTWGGGGRTSPACSPRCWWRSPTSGASASRVRRARVTPFCASNRANFQKHSRECRREGAYLLWTPTFLSANSFSAVVEIKSQRRRRIWRRL